MAYVSEKEGIEIDELLDFVEILKESGGGGTDISLFYITYESLVALRNAGQLAPGRFYRITDYVTTYVATAKENTRSAGHPFDIIVQAIDERTLSEEAQAIQHEGDTYFADSNLAAWKLKYTIDNDTDRFRWARADTLEVAQSWKTSWGVLEERKDNGASTNYKTAIVNGTIKCLYAPAERGTFLDSKEFYRLVGGKVYTSMDELLVATEFNPFDYDYETSAASEEEDGDDNPEDTSDIYSQKLYILDRGTGNVVVELSVSENYGSYENEDGEKVSNIGFYKEEEDDYFDMIHREGNTTTLRDKTYYIWEEYDGGYSQMSDTYLNKHIGATKEVYAGSKDSLYYIFDSVLPSASSQPTPQVYSTETGLIYSSDNWSDRVTWTAYVPFQAGAKGIIYRMIDEHGNDCPYDFKNILFEYNGVYKYTFNYSADNSDLSLTSVCFENFISAMRIFAGKQMMIPLRCIFDCSLKTNPTSFSAQSAGVYRNRLNVPFFNFYVASQRCGDNEWNLCSLARTNRPIINGTFTADSRFNSSNMSAVFCSNRFDMSYSSTAIIQSERFVGNKVVSFDLASSSDENFKILLYYVKECNISALPETDGANIKVSIGDSEDTSLFGIRNCCVDLWHHVSSIGFNPRVYLNNSTIKTSCSVKLTSSTTTSETSPIMYYNIDLLGGIEKVEVAVSNRYVGSYSENLVTHVGRNSEGNIVTWTPADLVDISE